MNIKKITIPIALLCLLLFQQGCSGDKTIDERPNRDTAEQEDVPMRFGVTAGKSDESPARTRGFETTLDDIDRVGIYGYYTANERWEWSARNNPGQLQPNYFTNEVLAKTGTPGDYIWTHPGQPRFWPSDTRYKVSFFAYSPYTASNAAGQAVIPAPFTPDQKGAPVLQYTVPKFIAQHIDLLRGANIDMTKYGADGIAGTPDDGNVPITMEHALTRITFSLQYANPGDDAFYSFTLSGIDLSGIYQTGTMRLDNGDWSFDPATLRTTLSMAGADLSADCASIDDGDKVYTLLNPALGELMLIPQELEGANLSLNVRITDANPLKAPIEVPVSFALIDTGVEWAPGRSIDYRILIEAGFISIHTTITPWRTAAASNVTVGL